MAALVDNALPEAVLARAIPDPQILGHAIGARQSVYRVLTVRDTGDGRAKVFSGTGFPIRTRGRKCLILTCDHVLKDDSGVYIDPHKGDHLLVRKMWDTEDARVMDFPARVCYNHALADLALLEATGITDVVQPLILDQSAIVCGTTAVAVGFSDVAGQGLTRTPTLSTGVTTSVPYRGTELVDLSCVATQGMSGGPVVSVGGGVLGVMATGLVDTDTNRLIATTAICTSKVLEVMKQWLRLPDNDARTLEEVIDMF